MNFTFSKKSKPQQSVQPIVAVFVNDESLQDKQSTQPFDYVKAAIESQQRHAAILASRPETMEESIPIPLAPGQPLGPAAVAAMRVGSSSSTASTQQADTSKSGLVILGEPITGSSSKHISKMVETSEVNAKFKNLLKIKIADREKDKAQIEFGQRPEEFITSNYVRQKQESLQLEIELKARESGGNRDVQNLFKDMLESGSYARSNYVTEKKITKLENQPVINPSTQQVKHVLSKIVPQDAHEVTRAMEERARLEAMKIIERIQENDIRDESRISAKEKYLQRKRQRLQSEEVEKNSL